MKYLIWVLRLLSTFPGGLGIHTRVKVTILAAVRNHILTDKYKDLVNESYSEPKKRNFWAHFDLNTNCNTRESTGTKRKKKNDCKK